MEMIELLFVDGNPAGVKSVLSAMGLIENVLRLPLVPTAPDRNKIESLMEKLRG